MFSNYLKTAFRNLWKHRIYSLINILGLAVGMTACFLIFLYVKFELSYDNFHSKADRIYRLVTDIKTPTETIHAGISSWPFAPAIKADMPGVQAFVRTSSTSMLLTWEDKKMEESRTLFADSSLFDVFDFELLKGNPKTALRDPMSVVLSQSTASKLFGNKDALGQTILITGQLLPAKITGIMKNIPENSIIKADLFVSMSSFTQRLNPGIDEQWGNFGAITYLLLQPGVSRSQLEKKFQAFLEMRAGREMRESKMFYTFFLEPLRNIYLRSDRDVAEKGSIKNVYLFSVIALFILLIACVNFINLSTARSAGRAREVGIRKVLGARAGQLTIQFLGESVIIALLAFLLSLFLSTLAIPLFNNLAGKTISNGLLYQGRELIAMFPVAAFIGILAGLYPSFILSAYNPVIVLKGRFSSGTGGIWLRKALVVFQFSISTALIIGTLVVYKQMKFMRGHDLGFNKDQVLVLNTFGERGKMVLKESIAQLPEVKKVAMSSSVPGGGNMGAYSEIENRAGDFQVANMDLYLVDYDYIPSFGIKILAGRSFSRDFLTDTTQAMVLNETAVKMFGYKLPEEAIGKKFRQWGREGKIIGVVKDFHFRALQENIKPLTMRIEPGACNLITARLTGKNIPAAINKMQHLWQEYIPNRPFSYYFLDEFFDKQYRAEFRFGNLFFHFALLAIFISCLGLLGLASYATMQRTREIAVRKVLGADTGGIVQLLSTEFMVLVLLSFFIAAPASWMGMHRWLEDFAYRTRIDWWIYALAFLLTVLISLATISIQTIRAALTNPVKTLHSD